MVFAIEFGAEKDIFGDFVQQFSNDSVIKLYFKIAGLLTKVWYQNEFKYGNFQENFTSSIINRIYF